MRRTYFRTILLSSACLALSTPAQFVHPGGLHKKSDLERMRYMVEARVEPWYAAFQRLRDHSGADMDYQVRGNPAWTTVNRDPCNHCGEFESDATAAYLNALMWSVTQDRRHADKAVQIFNTWKNLREFTGGGTEPLNAGLFIWKMVEAAEIIKHTYDGWSASDIQQFKDMLVYPGYSNTAWPASVNVNNGTFYWRIYNGDAGRHGNQDLIAWRATITMGVFLDNRIMYDRALRYFKGLSSRSDDLPYVSGPGVSTTQTADNPFFTTFDFTRQNSIPDYGYNGVLKHFVWENGQTQEASRDQGHAFFGLGSCAGIAEVAWNQGDTVWNSLDNRLLKGFEYMARYNTSFLRAYPDQPQPWVPDVIQRHDRTGRWFTKNVNPGYEADQNKVTRGNFQTRPVYEQAAAHFTVRMGFTTEALWTVRSRDYAIESWGYESNGFSLDHPGWGALTCRRPPLTAGDPISGFDGNGLPVFGIPVLPTVIEAENYDYFPGNGQGRTYHNLTPGNSGGQYRPEDGVDTEARAGGGHALTDLRAGEWLNYTVHTPTAGRYVVSMLYAASGAGGRIKLAFGGVDKTAEVPVPFGAQHSGGPQDWKDFTVDTVQLSAGVQSMRLFVAGESGRYKLDKIAVRPAGNSGLTIHGSGGNVNPVSVQAPGLFILPMPPDWERPIQARVFNLGGKAIRTFRSAGGSVTIDLRDAPKGRYPVQLESGGKTATEYLFMD